MRTVKVASTVEGCLAALVHGSVLGDAPERTLHQRFIASRMAAGLVALACLPPFLAWRNLPSTQDFLVLAALTLPLAAVLLLARTGRLASAGAFAAAANALLVVAMAPLMHPIILAGLAGIALALVEALVGPPKSAGVAAVTSAAAAGLAALGVQAAGIVPAAGAQPLWLGLSGLAVVVGTGLAARTLLRPLPQTAAVPMAARSDGHSLQAIDDLVTWHDRNGHVLTASPAAMKLLGVPASALQGRGLFGRVHVADRPAFLKGISDAAASARPVVVQFRLRVGDLCDQPAPERRDGLPGAEAVVWVEMRAHRVESPGAPGARAPGDAEGTEVVAVTRDVSEHMRRAEELEVARSEAERADALKGRFLATVSHELRTPLNSIIGFSEIMAADGMPDVGPERCREYAAIIRDSGQHLLEVVNTLLDISKIESGNFDLTPEPFAVAPLVNGCCDLVALKAEQGGVALVRDISPDLPEFVSDRRACRQILINLLSNAVKFTPRGGRITVFVRREAERLLFTVADTGIGISAEDLPRLGDPFFQASGAYDRPHEGTGLGLSVVRGLVSLHRGTLTIESAPGKGTSVTVDLPLDGRAPPPRAGETNSIETRRIETLVKPREPMAALKTG